jgi:hypothetical protein
MEVTLFWKVRTIGYASRRLVSSRVWGHVNRDNIDYAENWIGYLGSDNRKEEKEGEGRG